MFYFYPNDPYICPLLAEHFPAAAVAQQLQSHSVLVQTPSGVAMGQIAPRGSIATRAPLSAWLPSLDAPDTPALKFVRLRSCASRCVYLAASPPFCGVQLVPSGRALLTL